MYHIQIIKPAFNWNTGWFKVEGPTFNASTIVEASQIIDKAHQAFREQGKRQGRDYDIEVTEAK